MNQILILYRSKYGATKKYAELLKEEIACDVFDVKDFLNPILKIMTGSYLPEQFTPAGSRG